MATKIEWTEETLNPTTGCKKVSQGCKHCYAERLAPKVFAGQTITENGITRPRLFTDVVLHEDRIEKPLHWKKPRVVFVDSMSDLFQVEVPDTFLDKFFAMMGACDDQGLGHTFQILTKRADRMHDYMCTRARAAWNSRRMSPSAFPPRNVWLGVSVEDQENAGARIPLLLRTPAAVRFLSCEPLLGRVDLCETFGMWWNTTMKCFEGTGQHFNRQAYDGISGIDWVIDGGESGPKARQTHPDWFRALRDQCAAAGVPYFHKQNGEWVPCETEVLTEPPWKAVYLDDESIQLKDGRGYECIEAHGLEFCRVGKKAAGRLLDGQFHDGYPA